MPCHAKTDGVTGATGRGVRRDGQESHNQNMEQKQKVMGREGKEKILLKNGNMSASPYLLLGFLTEPLAQPSE